MTDSWFLKKDAVEYLVKKKPFIMAADTPYFDNVEDMQGIWDRRTVRKNLFQALVTMGGRNLYYR